MAKTNDQVFRQARKVLGEYLRAIREHRELSQTQLADSVGLRQADVSDVERGALNYGVDTLLAYCRGVDCYFFLGSRDGNHLDLDHLVKKMRDPI
jgi:transcriptional regulator with XRE-family HTH domain